jgi:hypothetical protein
MSPLLPLAALLLALLPLQANDGFGGIGASGLEFSRTDKVAMRSEDLFISLKKIRVSYVFENTSSENVTGEVIFPLPPIPVRSLFLHDMNLPENPDRENLVNFSITVDGQNIPPKIERRAFRHNDHPQTGADRIGEDITDLLQKAGVPLSLKPERLQKTLESLPDSALQPLVEAGLLEIHPGFQGGKEYWCNWAIGIRHHWTQTFPAGSQITISHEYENYPSGGIWSWTHPATQDFQKELSERYCIDAPTSKALARCRRDYQIDYILRTANTWQGPIDSFRLTIDKGHPKNILSLCATGVKKTGPTTFVIEKKNYTPPDDLRILIATP